MPPSSKTFKVHTSILFDPKKKAFLKNISIEVDRANGSIIDVCKRHDEGRTTFTRHDIDLTGRVVLPGFVDSHTHIFLHSYNERSGTQQMRDESAVERTVRATNHARIALLSGYTTYRDLGTKALGSADANLRDCINRGITPGPRLFVATDALASSGSYEIRRENRSTLEVPVASDVADDVDGVRAAVRRRVGAGADIIKFYADYRRKVMRFPNTEGADRILFPPARRNPAVPLYILDEMNEIVDEANMAEVPVAAHCGEARTAIMAACAGVTSVEHVFEDTYGKLDEMIKELVRNKVIWVPTLATAEAEAPQFLDWCKSAVKKAHDAGVRLAAGGDTGAFHHGLNVREMELMIEAGIPLEDVLESCTVGGWEACGGDMCGFRFGWFAKGNRADIIALATDPRKDRKAFRKVSFVMKDGQVWKKDGVPLGLVNYPQWPDEEAEAESSDEWTDLSTAQPTMSMSVPLPVYRSPGSLS
ncbi:putative Xaa-Pro dipeptide hydrolase [Rhypophila decipiens]